MRTIHHGEIERRRNSITHTIVSIYLADEAQLDPDGGNYVVVCEEHGTLLNCTTKRLAQDTMGFPDFCEECSPALYEFAKRAKGGYHDRT